jgi:adenine-specific DNA-methyltransferase
LPEKQKPGQVLENPFYLTRQLLTYLGSKRALLDFIAQGIGEAQKRLNKQKLAIFDVFSGSGIAARYFRQYAASLIANDLEPYSAVINRCYLANQSELDLPLLRETHRQLAEALALAEQTGSLLEGLISQAYAPKDMARIQAGERVFYTPRNARYIDTARILVGELPEDIRHFFLAPLLSEASIHANTAGIFKGFYKNKETGVGQFGGSGQNALARITGAVTLPFPVFSNFEVPVQVFCEDANTLADSVPEVDVAYLDPPYNQHPYGSNYFMLNLILSYKRPQGASRVSGIPENWNRSKYNQAGQAKEALAGLLERLKAKFVLVSFNSEGFIPEREMTALLNQFGKVAVFERPYPAFRGSRNLRQRRLQVQEYLYLLEK